MTNIDKRSFTTSLPTPYLQSAVLRTINERTVGLEMEILLKSLNTGKKKKNWYDVETIRNSLMICICLVFKRNTTRELMNNPTFMQATMRSKRSARNIKKIWLSFDEIDSFSLKNNTEIINIDRGLAVRSARLPVKTTVSKRFINREGYLACLITPYLRVSGAELSNGLSENKVEFTMGPSLIECFLVKNRVPASSMLLTLGGTAAGTSGDLWAGPVHFQRPPGGTGVYMTGAHNDPNIPRSILNVQRVTNKKIVDLRYLKRLNTNLKETLSPIDRLQAGLSRTDKVAPYSPLIKDRNYFSPIEYSRDLDNSIKFFFSFDAAQFAKDVAKYGYLYKSSIELLRSLKIYDIVIYRKRVLKQPMANGLSGIHEIVDRKYEDREEKVVCTLSGGGLRRLNLQAANDGFFHFVGSDSTRTDISAGPAWEEGGSGLGTRGASAGILDDGLYQHSVYIRYEDRSEQKLKNTIDKLAGSLGKYSYYVRLATNISGFNFSTNSFDKKAIDYLYTATTAWKDIVNSYLATIISIFGPKALKPLSVDQWQRNLLILTDPKTATPNSLLIVEKLAEELIDRLSSNIKQHGGVINVSASESKLNFDSKVESGKRDASSALPLVLSHQFPAAFDARKRYVGLQYIGGLNTSGRSIAQIDYKKWAARISQEKQYYAGGNAVNTSINAHGYLSPEAVITPRKVIGRNSMTLENGLPMIRNALDSYGYNIFGGQSNLTLKSSILNLEGVTIRPVRQKLDDILKSDQGCLTQIDSKYILGADSNFVFDDSASIAACAGPTGESIPGNNEAHIEGLVSEEEETMATGLVQEAINNIATKFDRNTIIDPLPIMGSLAAADLGVGANISTISDSFNFNLKYNSSMKIEYLARFKYSDHGFEVSAPDWQQLNEGIINEANLANKTLVCRMRRIDSITNTSDIYELTSFNKLFIIGKPKFSSSTAGGNTLRRIFGLLESSMDKIKINKGSLEIPIEYLVSEEAIINRQMAPTRRRRPRRRLVNSRDKDAARTRRRGTSTRGGKMTTRKGPSRSGGRSGRGGGGMGY